MSDRVFLDTNVIIYLYSEDEKEKRDAAYRVLNSNKCVTSTQAFNESSNIWYKKFNFDESQINQYLNEIEAVCDDIILIQRRTINQALSIKTRYCYSYYDCLMLASALDGNCRIFFTEDMSDGQLVEDKLKIVNPFSRSRRYP